MHNPIFSSQELYTCMGKVSKFDEEMWWVEIQKVLLSIGHKTNPATNGTGDCFFKTHVGEPKLECITQF